MDLEEYCCQDPEVLKLHDAACLMRRETGFCPQLPKVESLMKKIEWLLQASELRMKIDEVPEYCEEED